MNVALVITSYNDNDNLRYTIASALLHTDLSVKIVIVDDASNVPFTLNTESPSILIARNDDRLGISASRDIGIELARKHFLANWIIILDAHMLFHDKWLETIMVHIVMSDYSTVLSGVYTVLDKDHLSTHEPAASFGGSLFNFVKLCDSGYKIDWHDFLPLRTPHSALHTSLWQYDIPVMVGACYVVNVDWWQYLRGWAGLSYWGSEETCFCRKTWLSGGSVRLMTDVHVGHVTQSIQYGRTPINHISYNALHSLRCTMSEDEWNGLTEAVPPGGCWFSGIRLYRERLLYNAGLYKYLDSIRTKSNDWYCKKFGIATIEESIDLLEKMGSMGSM